MTEIRALVTYRNKNEPFENACSNTLYFQGIFGVGDYDGIAEDIAGVYQKARDGTLAGESRLIPPNWEINVRLYDMGDAKPRPIKGEFTVPQNANPGDTSPREVALCLSYYADRNLPRTRGRIYLGPFTQSVGNNMRPTTATMTSVIDLGSQLGNIGGSDILWTMHSVVNNDYHHITDIWCDDDWDTMRSRQLAPTRRLTGNV